MKFQLTWIFLLICSGTLISQDQHFSQFYNSSLNLSPGKTGVFNGDQRLNAGYRTQWRSTVPWNSFTAAYDRKFISKYCTEAKSFFSGGILLNYDKSSQLSDMVLTNINLTGSYTALINDQNLFTVGALLGYATRAFDENTLTWDLQWDGSIFNTGQPTGENFDSRRVSYLETGLGVNYRWQKSSRTQLDLGIGAYHLTTPGVGFYDEDDISLPARYTLSAIGSFAVANKLDLQLHGLAQFQGEYDEVVIGGLGKIHVSDRPGKAVQVHLGLGYRTSEVIFPVFAIQYNNIYGSVSYDIDMTEFGDFTDTRPRALEIHIGYRITNPKRNLKVCPIY